MASTKDQSSSTAKPLSLIDILHTPALRIELVAIIALTTDSMRRDLLSVFSPAATTNPGFNSDTSTTATSTGGTLIDLGVEHEARRTLRRQQSDLDSSATQGLRRAAVTFFDKWQIDVLRRLGEVLSVRPDAIRRARADAKAGAEAAEKRRRDLAYLDWANGIDEKASQNADANEIDATGKGSLPEGFISSIAQIPEDRKILILDSVLLLLLSLEHYSAHSRILMLKLTHILRLPESTLVDNESAVASSLLSTAAAKMSADDSTQRQASEGAAARRWKIGAATVAGAALIGITGGLAAPILAAGVGGIMGGVGLGAVASLLGPLATNMVLVGGLFGAYGGRMTGRIMEKYAREIKDFEFLPVSAGQQALGAVDDSGIAQLKDEKLRQTHKLRVVIGISGSVTGADGFLEPWKVFSPSRIEAFGLRWEMDSLLQLGRKISEILRSYVWDFAKFQLLGMILSGLWPFGLLRAASSLDSPFAVGKARSDKAGKVLADALVNRVQGNRPVTLVGFGLGARVIYSCLLQLADTNAFGLVESVVFMSAPAPSDAASWRRIRAVVSGRVVNAFSGDDFMLGFLYRASSAQMGIAGVQEIEGVAGVESFDLTDLVKSHDQYPQMVGTILQRVGFADLDIDMVRRQQQALEQSQQRRGESENLVRGLEDMDIRDNALARQDELGNVVKVENEKTAAMADSLVKPKPERPQKVSEHQRSLSHGQNIEDDEPEEEQHTIRMENNDDPLVNVAPEPEPDYGPDRETVRFGAEGRGFDVRWDYRA